MKSFETNQKKYFTMLIERNLYNEKDLENLRIQKKNIQCKRNNIELSRNLQNTKRKLYNRNENLGKTQMERIKYCNV